MILDLDKFHKSNYKEFVHKEALLNALKFVPETFLKDVDVKKILTLTFSVDDVGENPIYLTYLDKEDKEHIVKLRPAINEEISERLKDYAKVAYVDNQDITNLENSKNYSEVKFNELDEKTTVTINEVKEKLENDIRNSYALSVQDNATLQDTLTNSIEEHTQEAKNYSDTQIENTTISLKNYTDTKHNEALTQIQEGDETTLNVAESYTDTITNPLDKKLSNIWGGHKATFARYTDKTDLNNLELEKLSDNSIKATLNGSDVVYWNASQMTNMDNYYTKSEITEILQNLDSVYIEKIPASEMISEMATYAGEAVNFKNLEGDFTFIYSDKSKTNLIKILTNFSFRAPFTEILRNDDNQCYFEISIILNENITEPVNFNVQFYSSFNNEPNNSGTVIIGKGTNDYVPNAIDLLTSGYKSITEEVFNSNIEVRVLG